MRNSSLASLAGLSLLCGVAACHLPVGNASVDHSFFVGEWNTLAPVANGSESDELRVTFAGSNRDGTDGTVRWHYHSVQGASSADAGCDVNVYYEGSYYAKCGEQPVRPPSDPTGVEVPAGCFDMQFAHGWLSRTGCANADQNTPLGPYSVSAPNSGSFDHLGYFKLTNGNLLVEYIPDLEITRCSPSLCPTQTWPN